MGSARLNKEYQVKFREIMSTAITMLCRSGLRCKAKFCVEGLLGITLDDEDVFLVHINETVDVPTPCMSGVKVNTCKEEAMCCSQDSGPTPATVGPCVDKGCLEVDENENINPDVNEGVLVISPEALQGAANTTMMTTLAWTMQPPMSLYPYSSDATISEVAYPMNEGEAWQVDAPTSTSNTTSDATVYQTQATLVNEVETETVEATSDMIAEAPHLSDSDNQVAPQAQCAQYVTLESPHCAIEFQPQTHLGENFQVKVPSLAKLHTGSEPQLPIDSETQAPCVPSPQVTQPQMSINPETQISCVLSPQVTQPQLSINSEAQMPCVLSPQVTQPQLPINSAAQMSCTFSPQTTQSQLSVDPESQVSVSCFPTPHGSEPQLPLGQVNQTVCSLQPLVSQPVQVVASSQPELPFSEEMSDQEDKFPSVDSINEICDRLLANSDSESGETLDQLPTGATPVQPDAAAIAQRTSAEKSAGIHASVNSPVGSEKSSPSKKAVKCSSEYEAAKDRAKKERKELKKASMSKEKKNHSKCTNENTVRKGSKGSTSAHQDKVNAVKPNDTSQSCNLKRVSPNSASTGNRKKRNQEEALRYECSVCGKLFSKRRNWQEHSWAHQGIFPYHCGVCRKGFRFRNELNGHMVKHTRRKEFMCELCGREFAYSQSWRAHMKEKHKVQVSSGK